MTVCLDEMGPVRAGTYPGKRLVRPSQAGPGPGGAQSPRGRATREPDYAYRGSGFVYGAFIPATGEALTHWYRGRNGEAWFDFLSRVEAWLPPEATEVLAILDNLSSHLTLDVLLFTVAHPRWKFLFIPSRSPYLNLVESWWPILRSLALHGRRFENYEEVKEAIEAATAYWNAHKHPFLWGRRKRHRPRRKPGIAGKPPIPRWSRLKLAI